jgi:hypothetical protein
MANRTYVDELPSNAIQCDGPLMFDTNRYVTPDGRLFSVHPTSHRIKVINLGIQRQWAWSNAKQILPDGTIANMPSIEGFYASSNGRMTPAALMAYYFIEKIDPTGMRAINTHPNGELNIDYIRWGSKQEQDTVRLNTARSMVNPNNIYQEAIDIDMSEYSEFGSSNYFVKRDGTDVVTMTTTDKLRRVSIRAGTDGYHNVILHIGGKPKGVRMNRLMAAIHHGLDLDDSSQVVDHLDSNITNNHPSNLQVVSLEENTRRGASCTPIFKVDPSTMRLVESIRSITEFAKNNPDNLFKTLNRVRSTGEQYNNFIWLDQSLEGLLFTRVDDVFTLSIWSIDKVIEYARTAIYQLVSDDKLSEDLLPLDANNMVTPSKESLILLDKLDPRGVGDVDIRTHVNDRIQGHMPCCKVISIHGNCTNSQLVLCTQTMVVFARSRDNLTCSDRLCPMCARVATTSTSRVSFGVDRPEMGIPVYAYNPAAGKQANGAPLLFREQYLTVPAAIESDGGEYAHSKLLLIRQSLFGVTNKSSDHWIKEANGFPKRKVYRGLYWSFHPPIDNKLDERSPDWLLRRRLESVVMVQLRTAVLSH